MKVLFEGGPLRGKTREITASMPEPDRPFYWSVSGDVEIKDPSQMDADVAEYLYKGQGLAEYLAGRDTDVDAQTPDALRDARG